MSTQRDAISGSCVDGSFWGQLGGVTRNGRSANLVAPIAPEVAGEGEALESPETLLLLLRDLFSAGLRPVDVFGRLMWYPAAVERLGFCPGSYRHQGASACGRIRARMIYGSRSKAKEGVEKSDRTARNVRTRFELTGKRDPELAPVENWGQVPDHYLPQIFAWVFPRQGRRPRFTLAQSLRRVYYMTYKIARPYMLEANKADLASMFGVTKTLITQEMSAMFEGIQLQSSGEFSDAARRELSRAQRGNRSAQRGGRV